MLLTALAALWFATPGFRESRAARFDAQASERLKRHDYAGAERRAQVADALKHTTDRRLTAASVAYLNRDFTKAADLFKSLRKDDVTRATIGERASAAAAGDRARYDAVSLPSQLSTTDQLALTYATLTLGDFDGANRQLSGQPIDTRTAAYAGALAAALNDPAKSAALLTAAPESVISLPEANDAFGQVLTALMDVPSDGIAKLTVTVATLQNQTAKVSRQTTLAASLIALGQNQPAERLARDAVSASPAYRDAWNTLALAQINLGQNGEAAKSLKTSTDLDGAYGYTWFLRAELAKRQQDPTEAEYRKKAETFGYRPT